MVNNKSRSFPLDIFSVKDQGLKNWIKYNSNWPIKDDESILIGKKIIDRYSNLIRKVDDEKNKALLISQNKIVMEISGIFHSLLVLERLEKDDLKPSFYKDTIFFPGLNNKQHKIVGVYDKYSNKLIPSEKKGFKNKLKSYLFVIYRKIISIFDSEHIVYSLNHKNHSYLTKYSNDKQKKVRFYPINNYKRSHSLINSVKIDNDALITQILQILINLADEYKLNIPDFVLKSFYQLIENIFCETSYQIAFYYKKLAKQKPRTYFIPSLGHIDFRNFAIAAKLAGHRVLGASHGNSIAMFDIQLRAFIDLSIVDNFLVATEYAAHNYTMLHKKYLQGISETKVYSVNSMYYDRLKSKHAKMESLTKLRKVMVIEYPLTEIRHNIYSFWPYQLRLMLEVGEFLKNKGVSTIMKRHPDRITESDGLYKSAYSEQILEPFEDVFDQADAYFFMNITSTTFGFAITTNRPIFIFTTWLDEVWEDMQPLIRKRCIAIPSWIDDKGKLNFDREYFSNKLKSESIWKINHDALDKFFIPQITDEAS